MSFSFDPEKIGKITDVLGVDAENFGNGWTWKLTNPNNPKPMVCTLYNDIEYKDSKISVISVQTQHGYYEMHNITDFMVFEPDEIIFVNNEADKISCLILGKEGSCSLFSNINKELLTADFSEIDPALLLSAMQLSITENMLN